MATMTVQAGDSLGEFTPTLVAGAAYRLEVTGTYQYASASPEFEADAECSTELGDLTWDPHRFPATNDDPLDLYVDDGIPNNGVADGPVKWQPLVPDASGDCAGDPDHTYEFRFISQFLTPINLKIVDPLPADDSGFLTVSLYQVDTGGLPGGTSARVVVPADDSDGVATPPLVAGESYILRAIRTYTYGTDAPDSLADAECSTGLDDAEFIADRYGDTTPDPGDAPLDVYVSDGIANGVADGPVAWQPAEATTEAGDCAADGNHTYEYRFTAQVSGPLTLKVQDSTYPDNAGEIIVDVVQIVSEIDYTHDANGNLTAAGETTYAYDQANRLIQLLDGPTTLGYTYDGEGKRASSAEDSPPMAPETIAYTWDPAAAWPQLVAESDAAGTTVRSYTLGADTVSLRAGGEDFYYHHDGLGSVVGLTDSSAARQWSYAYEPFGGLRDETALTPDAPANDLLFTGELYDRASGLYHLRARQYDPTHGRFLTTDPVPAQIADPYVASYVYVNNRPTVAIDPRGEFFNLGLGAVGALVGSVIGGVGSVVATGDLSLRTFASGAAAGAVAGFAAGATVGLSVGATLVATAAGGAGGVAAAAAVCGRTPSTGELVSGALLNVGASYAGDYALKVGRGLLGTPSSTTRAVARGVTAGSGAGAVLDFLSPPSAAVCGDSSTGQVQK